MISSTSSSSRLRPLAAVLATATLAACGHARPAAAPAPRIAIFPVQNASGGNAPIRRLTETVETVVASCICKLIATTFADAEELWISPYSFTTPVITASALSMPQSFTTSSGEGVTGTAMPSRVIARETSPVGIT